MFVAIGLACASLAAAFLASRGLGLKQSFHNFPPGPSGKWFIGNLAEFLSEYPWKTFTAWSKTFGDIIYFTVIGRPIIILNNFEHARELMDRRSGVYSDRPWMVYIAEMLKVRSVTFMQYGDLWRTHRRLLQQYLNPRAVVKFRPLQIKCVLDLLEDLVENPDAFWKHVKRFAASAVLSTTYGYRVAREDDPLVMLNSHSERAIVTPGPIGATLVDFFPICRYLPPFLPGASLQKIAVEAREGLKEMADWPYQVVREQRAAGVAVPSLMTLMIDDLERHGITDEAQHDVIKDVCASMYRAGVATTSAVLYTFFLAMVLHPQVAKKAQKELDTVLKGERLPSFDDQESLPYIACVVKECLRWAPPFPLGIVHRNLEEDVLEGRCIPKGSMILPNIWHMMHDERNYVEPEKFDPDRFLNHPDSSPSVLDPASAVFGFGRRICPGRHFAEADLWLAMGNIFTVFDILPAKDENGLDILPKVDFLPGNNCIPKEFRCCVVTRSESTSMLVKTALNEQASSS